MTSLLRAGRAARPADGHPSRATETPSERKSLARYRMVAAILLLLAVLGALLPFAQRPSPVTPGLVGAFGAGVGVVELATGVLLLASFRIERSWSLQILASAYIYSALMSVGHVLTFPGAILSDAPVIGATRQGPAWVFLLWILIFALLCLAAVLAEVLQRRPARTRCVQRAVWRAVAMGGALSAAAIVVPTLVSEHLPDVLASGSRWTVPNLIATLATIVLLSACVVLILTYASGRPIMGWLAVALASLLCANLVSAAGGGRYTVGWTAGRVFWLVSACVLLAYFLQLHVRQQQALRSVTVTLRKQLSRKRAEIGARDARHLAIVSTASDAILTKTLDGMIDSWNPAAERLLGYTRDEIIGKSVRIIIPPSRQSEEDDILRRITTGERIASYDTERMTKAGKAIEVSLTASPLFVGGHVTGASSIMHDISARKRRERQNSVLLQEVNHRSKNLLAVVQAIARQTACGTPDAFLSAFTARLGALAASHDLLVESQWEGVDLRALVGRELERFHDLLGSRITITGPDIRLSPQTTQLMGMIFHELATNAAKYGALSNDNGRIWIIWAITERAGRSRLHLEWQERDGPPIRTPSHKGFGTTLLRDVPTRSLQADITLAYPETGLVWSLDAAMDDITEETK